MDDSAVFLPFIVTLLSRTVTMVVSAAIIRHFFPVAKSIIICSLCLLVLCVLGDSTMMQSAAVCAGNYARSCGDKMCQYGLCDLKEAE